ncbi:hypothetical protein INS49_001385 [Diaporthe citri]|uniref:uncharacterized protein n=1 Tax=Diaporthe citri TaxID=83186 RepID=UPI001C812F50|nr:uncharacterized protein INS49_001385 [Diaporthe citri]KAG6367200.1 hypothetical protein INS49_001385 [Diaporthe citri]
MAFKFVYILILMGFTFGAHVGRDNTDLEARTALPQPSWVDLGPEPFGGLPRQRDMTARKFPLETLITRESTSADITEQNTQSPVPLPTSSGDESLNERHGGEFYHRPKSSSSSSSEGDYYPTAKPSSTSSSSEGYGEPFSSSPDYTHSHNCCRNINFDLDSSLHKSFLEQLVDGIRDYNDQRGCFEQLCKYELHAEKLLFEKFVSNFDNFRDRFCK